MVLDNAGDTYVSKTNSLWPNFIVIFNLHKTYLESTITSIDDNLLAAQFRATAGVKQRGFQARLADRPVKRHVV